MSKIIDLRKTVYELVQEHPELIGVMQDLGFANIVNPAMLRTAGRVMTIPKGATMRGLHLEAIKAELGQTRILGIIA